MPRILNQGVVVDQYYRERRNGGETEGENGRVGTSAVCGARARLVVMVATVATVVMPVVMIVAIAVNQIQNPPQKTKRHNDLPEGLEVSVG